ncbi:preprotein translocase subunit YajC [Cryobacterium sp. TMS1-20-1]|uniref:Preprotein translocase subunit YajC n=1 Tax=Cryobacterium levicorallinum TaxID=995038 RepID=A0A1I3A360_9MICO|nr:MULTISPECIES: preprotein translocase subunit YajC [Cryobacterium]TFB82683.1 preprotein translocase subunit YajC [Cryobacterium levicorallinum]TFC82017.1 preprotein translocase subunit YajC [Cryobacterium sp. TMS1-20-1]TFD54351.1 preprotein translocase subunit YajC [Cryobacterium sp. Hh11]TFD60776.1 preprotein translocase subunit YajC [Cryobacterium sp. Hh7]TFD65972.1 preprotein translocase subunit YajC [Cryobacterium sp. Hh38]
MDSLTLVMLAVLAVLVFFMFRNGRKRKKDQEALQATMVPGADVMTNFGMYGTIIAIDEEANKVELQIAPGVIVEIHRQTIARVVEPIVADDVEDDSAVESIDSLRESELSEPEFGQRVVESDTDTTEQPKKGDA